MENIGGINFVRPPTLIIKKNNETPDYKEYTITTYKTPKDRNGDDPTNQDYLFTSVTDSMIFCNETMKIQMPKKSFMIKDGKKRFAYAVGMFPNPKNKKAAYLDGCILAALGLRRQKTNADIICFITHDISSEDKKKLEIVFDKVMYVPYISPYDMGGEGNLKTIMMFPNFTKSG